MGPISHDDLGEHPSFGNKIKTDDLELFFETEDLIKDTWSLQKYLGPHV